MSVFFGVLTLLLLALWMRSYWTRDNLSMDISRNRGFQLESAVGQVAARMYPVTTSSEGNRFSIYWGRCPTASDPCHPANNRHGFDAYFDRDYAGFVVPHWLLLVLAAAGLYRFCEATLKWRFSLRSLLIATTLLAVVLGLAVWAGG